MYVTQDLEDPIYVIQRTFLRGTPGIKWSEKISNIKIYMRTRVAKWIQVVQKGRLRWYGHMQRIDDNIPSRQALKETLHPVRKPQGSATTNLAKVKNNLIDTGIQHYCSIDHVNTAPNGHSLQAVELSQWTQAAVQIMLNLIAPSNGGPIYRFLGMPAMRTHWMAGVAAHKGG